MSEGYRRDTRLAGSIPVMDEVATRSASRACLLVADSAVASGQVKRKPDQDAGLVADSKAGNLTAFEELVRRHERPLFGYLYRMCGNGNDAEELAQAAFVRAWKALAGFEGRSSFKTWLYRIATNLAINKRTRTRPTVELSELLTSPEQEQPEESFQRKRREEVVWAALDRLSPDQRSALVLSVYERMSYKEIAEAMGKSVRAVDSLLVRARVGVRKILGPARRKGVV